MSGFAGLIEAEQQGSLGRIGDSFGGEFTHQTVGRVIFVFANDSG